MAEHPTESWREGMVADELRSWIESSFAPYLLVFVFDDTPEGEALARGHLDELRGGTSDRP